MEYKVIKEESLEALVKQVNHALGLGDWKPTGGMVVDRDNSIDGIDDFYLQAMIRE